MSRIGVVSYAGADLREQMKLAHMHEQVSRTKLAVLIVNDSSLFPKVESSQDHLSLTLLRRQLVDKSLFEGLTDVESGTADAVDDHEQLKCYEKACAKVRLGGVGELPTAEEEAMAKGLIDLLWLTRRAGREEGRPFTYDVNISKIFNEFCVLWRMLVDPRCPVTKVPLNDEQQKLIDDRLTNWRFEVSAWSCSKENKSEEIPRAVERVGQYIDSKLKKKLNTQAVQTDVSAADIERVLQFSAFLSGSAGSDVESRASNNSTQRPESPAL